MSSVGSSASATLSDHGRPGKAILRRRKNLPDSGCQGLPCANLSVYNSLKCGRAAQEAREGVIFSNLVVWRSKLPGENRSSPGFSRKLKTA